MNPSNRPSVHDQVLEKIGRGEVRMRSKAYFVLRLFVLLFVAVAVFLLSALIASFIFFNLRESGEEYLLGFGARGILTFLALLPWALLSIDLAAIVLLRVLLAGFRAVYRVSFLTTLGGIVFASVLVALLINLTPLHSGLRERADLDDLLFFDELYENVGNVHEERGEFRGTILSIEGRTLTIFHDDNDNDEDDGTRRIFLPESIDISVFEVGDEVYIGGEHDDDGIRAYGIREFER